MHQTDHPDGRPRQHLAAAEHEGQNARGPCDERDPDHNRRTVPSAGLRVERGHSKPQLASSGREQANQSVTPRRGEGRSTQPAIELAE